MGNRSLIGDRAPYVAAVVAGLIVGWLNIHTNETPFVALPLLAAAFTLGFLTPRGAWRWFILVEMWLPLGQIWANLTNTHIPYPNGWSDIGNAAMASGIVALVGTYAGVFGRWILGHLSEDATHETR